MLCAALSGACQGAPETEDERDRPQCGHGRGAIRPSGTLSLGVAVPQPLASVDPDERVVWEAPHPGCLSPEVRVLRHVDGWVEVEAQIERVDAWRYSIRPRAGWATGATYRVGVRAEHPIPTFCRDFDAREPLWTEVGVVSGATSGSRRAR
jgi:hypothetical protein